MTTWRFLVTYEGTIEAGDEEEADAWAREEVDAGLWQVTTSQVERIATDDA